MSRIVLTRPSVAVGYTQEEIDDFLATKANISDITIENGYEDRTKSVMSFDEGTRTFTISPTGSPGEFSYWAGGEKYTKTTPQTVIIDDIEGIHAISFLGDTLISQHAPSITEFEKFILPEYAFTAVVYWNATDQKLEIFNEERHGRVMDSRTHVYLHRTVHTQYGSGIALTNIIADDTGDADEHAQLGHTSGDIWDEDIKHVIPAVAAPASIPTFYRLGIDGNWRSEVSEFVVIPGVNRAYYNEFTGAEWLLTEVPSNGNYTLTHYFATGDLRYPLIKIMGQSQHGNLAEAQAAAVSEIHNLSLGNLQGLSVEFVAIATVIVQTSTTYANAPNARIVSTEDGGDYIDWRDVTGIGSGSSAATDHNSLTGLQGGTPGQYYHLTSTQHALVTGLSLSTINGQPTLTMADGVRSGKILSVAEQTLTFSRPQMQHLDWLNVGDAVDADSGFVADFDGTIVFASGHCEDTGINIKEIHVFINEADIGSIGSLSGGTDVSFINTTLDVDFVQGDKIRLQAQDLSGAIQDTIVKLTIKWRA